MFSDEFGGKAQFETVWCVLVDTDMTMRSQKDLQAVCVSKERAEEWLKTWLSHWHNWHPNTEIKPMRVE